jgi:DNA-binding XRE family transcriptional regulator
MTTAERIKNMREKLWLSQQELANITWINRASLSQIELWNRKVSSKELTQFASIFECDVNELLWQETKITYDEKNKENNHYGIKQLILYIAQNLAWNSNFGETLLNKLLYFADFNHFERTWRLISWNEKYIKLPYWPVPENILEILAEMEKDGQIQRVNSLFRGYTQKKVIPLQEPDMSYFYKKDKENKQKEENYEPYEDLPNTIEIIDDVLNKYGHWTASMLSEWSHLDIPYKSTDSFWDEIEPEMVFYRTNAFITNQHNLDQQVND